MRNGFLVIFCTSLIGLVFGPVWPLPIAVCIGLDMVLGLSVGMFLYLRLEGKNAAQGAPPVSAPGPAILGILGGIAAAIALSILLHGFVRLATGGEVTARARVLPAHAHASVFHIEGGVLPERISGFKASVGKYGSTGHYRARPIVYEGWTRNDPVPAWAVCHGDRCLDEYIPRGMRPASIFERENFEAAVLDAESRYHLKSIENAPLIELAMDPHDKFRWVWIRALIAVGVIYAIWLVVASRA
ncbi:MAG: hypothetical protein HY042_08575 [Spirochaetia bacterium]|nr:hypothetical protein [Spirochaetia bacterium]